MILVVIKKTIPYNNNGNALRFMVANDRPSAYEGIFISFVANQKLLIHVLYWDIIEQDVNQVFFKKYTCYGNECFE